MPTIFRREVVDAVWVMEIFGARRGLTRGFAGVFGGKKMRGWVGAEGALPGAQMRGTWGTPANLLRFFGERKCGGGLRAEPTSQKRDAHLSEQLRSLGARDVGHPLSWSFQTWATRQVRNS